MAAEGDGTIHVTVGDVTHVVRPDRPAVFGRGAEIDLGNDRRLHRSQGRLDRHGGTWWLSNTGRSAPLHLVDESLGSITVVPPGCQAPVCSPACLVWLRHGETHFELQLTQPGVLVPPEPTPAAVSGATTRALTLPINEEQRLLLTALCESRLRDPLAPLQLPPNRAVAQRLGWTVVKFNRKLDYLCQRGARIGIAGLTSEDGRASDRRRCLAEWAIEHGVVGPDDLPLLP